MTNNLPKKPKTKKLVYLDHAATTYVSQEVEKATKPFITKIFGNPSSLYELGRIANGELNDCRRKVAEILHALPDNIIFTGGGSESDNLAIFGVCRKIGKGHIIATRIEHHAVLYPCQQLEKEGFTVTYLEPDSQGFISPKKVLAAIKPDTILISIMYANNEIGTVEPIADIGREILKYRKANNPSAGSGQVQYPIFHTDACQAGGVLELDVEKLHVDLMTLNGSKIYGPKGVGLLYKRRGVNIQPLIFGGGQEMNLRSGTENLAGIVGFTKALEIAQENRHEENMRLVDLRNYFFDQIQKNIKNIRLNGPQLHSDKNQSYTGQAGSEVLNRLPNNLNITFIDVEGEAMLLYLDAYGICCSTGSACTSMSLEPSHVLTALGLPYEYAHGSLRFTLGYCNTKQDIDYVMRYLPAIVEKLREMSPVQMGKVQHAKYKK
ncbi:MAG: Cysteine desulfurase [Candidatus Magasanikbacteria bacterium GW2011_GWC2_37_14]|uniref:Cysteine desulfurase n=1 Tax=Candidatus Magasanikbacteria bacterium GW2011_GWC2_37_14 TaxID=1619046 RepID=A0A0G0JJ01_9BACT|nr:MAG: Cysteine desulfurase [Candidatus Magasanikbacteria bacterium GW2011_GWC2_37_14]